MHNLRLTERATRCFPALVVYMMGFATNLLAGYFLQNHLPQYQMVHPLGMTTGQTNVCVAGRLSQSEKRNNDTIKIDRIFYFESD